MSAIGTEQLFVVHAIPEAEGRRLLRLPVMRIRWLSFSRRGFGVVGMCADLHAR